MKDPAEALCDLSDHIKNQDLIENGINALHKMIEQLQQELRRVQQAVIERQDGLQRFSRRLEAVESRPTTAPVPQLARGDAVVAVSIELLQWAHDVCEQHFKICEDDIGHRDLGMLALIKQRLGTGQK